MLAGALRVTVGGETRTLTASGTAIAPENTLHDFRNVTDEPARFLLTLRPGRGGFEKSLQVAYGLASDGLSNSRGMPKSVYHTAPLLQWVEGRTPGVFVLVEPVSRLLAKWARRKGVDRELEARYCR